MRVIHVQAYIIWFALCSTIGEILVFFYLVLRRWADDFIARHLYRVARFEYRTIDLLSWLIGLRLMLDKGRGSECWEGEHEHDEGGEAHGESVKRNSKESTKQKGFRGWRTWRHGSEHFWLYIPTNRTASINRLGKKACAIHTSVKSSETNKDMVILRY